MDRLHHHVHHHFRHTIFSLTAFGLMAALVAVGVVGAASLNNMSDSMSRMRVGTNANHLIEFDTPSGAAEGTTMTVTFDSSFDTSSITENDIDVEDDGVDLTTAPDCTGVEQAGVTIAGDVVTVEICVGDGGAIAGGSTVTMEIGTNATASGIGANQIENPAVAGTYEVAFGGTFGDTGSAYVAIVDNDSVVVTATVDSDDEPPNDCAGVVAPVISNVQAQDVTAGSARITWTTSASANSVVAYGETTSYELGTEIDNDLSSGHSIDLTGLDPNTTYYYRVSSTEVCNNTAQSGPHQFTTLGPLEITDVQVINITQTSATVVWYTNKIADSLVEYGLTNAYGSSEYETGYVSSHSVDLSGLSPDTEYHFHVISETDDEYAESADDAFFTLPIGAPPNVEDFLAEPGPGPVEITLTWTNPVSDDWVGVEIYRRDDAWPTGVGDGTFIYDGNGETTVDVNVVTGVNYYYCAYSYNDLGEYSSGACDDAMIPEVMTLEVRAHPEKRWPQTGNWHTDLDVKLWDSAGETEIYAVTLATDNQAGEGTVDLFDVPYGTYDFSGKGLSHLSAIVYALALTDETFVDFTYGLTFDLLAGDVNPTRDDFVNSLDISALLGDLNNDDEVTDLNQDSLVNSLDINILLTNLNKWGELGQL